MKSKNLIHPSPCLENYKAFESPMLYGDSPFAIENIFLEIPMLYGPGIKIEDLNQIVGINSLTGSQPLSLLSYLVDGRYPVL